MGKYDHLSKEELIQRIERLEADLEKATLTPSASDNELEMRQSQHTINFLNILMDTILSNVFVEITVKDIFNGFRYIYFNKAAEEFTGVKAEDILGKTDFELFPDSRRAHEIRTEDYHTIKTGRMVKEMVEYEKPNGEVRIVNIVRLLITNPDPGASPLLLVMLNDITEQRQDQLALMKVQEADKMKNAFIANMSHEIRTPLNAITGFSELMAFADTDEERMSYYDVIKMNNQLLMQLINDILDISKIEADAIKITYEQLDVSELMDTIYASAKLRVPGGVKLVLEKEADHHMFGTDSMRLLQLINNLVNNAIKNTKEGSITMGYTIQPDDQLRFYVRDTGIGIDKEKLKDVFDRFVKINDYMEGIGLGLAICKGLVVKMGGSIHVTSELGVGSEFSFILPSHE